MSYKPNQTKQIQHIPLRAGSEEDKLYAYHASIFEVESLYS